MKKFIVIIAIGAIASSVLADGTWDGEGADTDWYTAENWGDDTLPLASSNLTFGAGAIATIVDGDSPVYGSLGMDSSPIITQTDGTLNIANDMVIKSGTYILDGSSAILNIIAGGKDIEIVFSTTDGLFDFRNGTINLIDDLIIGSFGADDQSKVFKISGGTLAAGGTLNMHCKNDYTGCEGVFQVVGSTAVITIGAGANFGNSAAYTTPTLDLEFDDSGISLIDISGKLNFIACANAPQEYAKLIVDVSALPAVSATYDLIKYDTLANAFGSVDVTDAGGAMTEGTWDSLGAHEYALRYDGGAESKTVQLQVVTVPEPAFLGFLGLVALAWLRRK